jgi:CHASE3 domain sensor protein
MKRVLRNILKSISEFKFKNALFFIGIVLSIYLIAGCMLGLIQESQARTNSVILEHK